MRQLLFTLTALGLLLAAAAADQIIIGERDGKDIVTVRATEATQSKQALTIFTGISANTAGANGLSLLKVIIPPGGSAEAHVHKGYESRSICCKAASRTRYGEGLKKSVVNVGSVRSMSAMGPTTNGNIGASPMLPLFPNSRHHSCGWDVRLVPEADMIASARIL